MAAQRAKSVTLVADTSTPINFPQYFATITVVNRSQSTDVVWIRTDGGTPTVAGDDAYPVLPGQAQSFPNGALLQDPVLRVQSGTQTLLISSTACPITVYGT